MMDLLRIGAFIAIWAAIVTVNAVVLIGVGFVGIDDGFLGFLGFALMLLAFFGGAHVAASVVDGGPPHNLNRQTRALIAVSIVAGSALCYVWSVAKNALETAERAESALTSLVFKSAVEACREEGLKDSHVDINHMHFDYKKAKLKSIKLVGRKYAGMSETVTHLELYADGLPCRVDLTHMSATIE